MNVFIAFDLSVNEDSEILKVFDDSIKAKKFIDDYANEINARNESLKLASRFEIQSDGSYYMQGCGWLKIIQKTVE